MPRGIVLFHHLKRTAFFDLENALVWRNKERVRILKVFATRLVFSIERSGDQFDCYNFQGFYLPYIHILGSAIDGQTTIMIRKSHLNRITESVFTFEPDGSFPTLTPTSERRPSIKFKIDEKGEAYFTWQPGSRPPRSKIVTDVTHNFHRKRGNKLSIFNTGSEEDFCV